MAVQTILGLAAVILLVLIFIVLIKLLLIIKERQEIRNPNLPGPSPTTLPRQEIRNPILPGESFSLPITTPSRSHLYSSYPVSSVGLSMDGWYFGVPSLFGCTRLDGNLVAVGNRPLQITFANLLEARFKPLGMGKSAYLCLPWELNLYLTLKQLKSMPLSSSEFRRHINLLEGIDHDHLLPIRAYCYDQDYKFILYDFLFDGSLFNLIHDRGPLHLDDVIRISLGVASGIKHLHDNHISHGNVKSSNVAVSKDMHVRLLPFGHHHGSQEDDVYNFGVVLLELLSRRNPKLSISYEGKDISFVDWMFKMTGKHDKSFLDVLSQGQGKQIDDLLLLALDCLNKKCDMFFVIQKIGELQKELCNRRNWWFWG